METNLLDRMLNTYQDERTPVRITLQNKIHVTGRICAFDSYVIVIDGQKREILYRHAVASVAPAAAPKEEPRHQAAAARPSTQKPASRPQKSSSQKQRPSVNQHLSAAAPADSSLNSTLKDGLMKWMQEQKSTR
jgi:RNA chaperone Hfq